ncbi:MAG TPA: hypothetical protein VF504_02630 [Solirubrobacterales bacterium]
MGDIEDVALRDRRLLSADGIFIVVATISGDDGRSVAPPELIFRGVPFSVRKMFPAGTPTDCASSPCRSIRL